MRIALVAQPFDLVPPATGGSLGIWAEELARELSLKHDVTIYSRCVDGRPNKDVIDGVRHLRVSTSRDEKKIGRFQRVEQLVNRLFRRQTHLFYRCYYFASFYYQHYINAISKKIAENEEELIVVINFSQFVSRIRARNRSKKILLVMQCDWLKELEPSQVGKRLHQTDAILGCSDYITQGIAKQYPKHAHKCHTLYNASNLERFGGESCLSQQARELKESLGLGNKTVVAFVGRVAPEKGLHVLVEAMKQVAATRENTVLLIIGSMSRQPPSPLWLRKKDLQFRETETLKPCYWDHLLDLIKGYEKTIHLLGSVSHYDLPTYYEITDVFVHPAVWQEPFGMILTEAMAARRAVISTKVGGVPEIVVHGETGLLVEPDDADALATAIIELAEDKERRNAMGARGQLRAYEKFSWSIAANRFDSIIKSLSEGPQ